MTTNKCSDALRAIPLGTLILLLTNVIVHALLFLSSLNPGLFAISYNNVFKGEMYYTVLSSAFVHGSLMHIGFNMMSLVQLGPALESQFGTSQFLFMTAWSVIFCGLIYILIEYFGYVVREP